MSQIRYLRVNLAAMSGGRQAASRRAMPRPARLAISAGALYAQRHRAREFGQELNDGADFATMLA
jgi:hypothetical protein